MPKFGLCLIDLCPPGTKTRLLNSSQRHRYPDQSMVFMPFCITCGEGYYQPEHNHTLCWQCPENYTSLPGSKSIDECYLPKSIQACQLEWNQCSNQGSCVKSSNEMYHCKCKGGFYGWRCEHQIDPCLSGPCFNDGECHSNGSQQFTCKCSTQFEGTLCELSVPKCKLDFCKSQGQCLELPNGEAQCICQTGFVGQRCDIKHDHCADLSCEHGKCDYSRKGLECKCDEGYLGKRCHLKPCDYSPCNENMKCINILSKETNRSSYMCECKTWFTGIDCRIPINPCEPNPCQNNGVCKAIESDENHSKFVCTCPIYFFGASCETLITPNYEMHFEQAGIANYVELGGPKWNLTEVCKKLLKKRNSSF